MNGYVCRSDNAPGRGYSNGFRPQKRRESQRKKKCTFCCRYDGAGNDFRELMQGILYSDRSCLIGIDVWRLLNRMDTCEYPYKRYESIEKANVTIVPAPKVYYLEK